MCGDVSGCHIWSECGICHNYLPRNTVKQPKAKVASLQEKNCADPNTNISEVGKPLKQPYDLVRLSGYGATQVIVVKAIAQARPLLMF